MSDFLSDQERLEAETSMRMTPREHLAWLAAAWTFVQMTKGKKLKKMKQEKAS